MVSSALVSFRLLVELGADPASLFRSSRYLSAAASSSLMYLSILGIVIYLDGQMFITNLERTTKDGKQKQGSETDASTRRTLVSLTPSLLDIVRYHAPRRYSTLFSQLYIIERTKESMQNRTSRTNISLSRPQPLFEAKQAKQNERRADYLLLSSTLKVAIDSVSLRSITQILHEKEGIRQRELLETKKEDKKLELTAPHP